MCLVRLVRDGTTRLILAVTMRKPAYQQQTMEDSRGKAAKVAQEL